MASSDVGWLDDLAPHELEPDPDQPGADQPQPTDDEPAPKPLFDDLEPWVTEYFAPIIARRLNKAVTWCPEWWRHAEVIARLRALWEAWEAARLEGGAEMSAWWYVQVDAHLAVIMDGNSGPLSLCSPEEHKGLVAPLMTRPAPADWWSAEQPEP